MITSKLVTLSTAHLHPLESQKLDSVSFMSCTLSALIRTDDYSCEECERASLCCLADLMRTIRNTFGVDYIIFDPDGEICPTFKTYDW